MQEAEGCSSAALPPPWGDGGDCGREARKDESREGCCACLLGLQRPAAGAGAGPGARAGAHAGLESCSHWS
eukprot:8660568-Alexandrium_andersonii.AAC.1